MGLHDLIMLIEIDIELQQITISLIETTLDNYKIISTNNIYMHVCVSIHIHIFMYTYVNLLIFIYIYKQFLIYIN